MWGEGHWELRGECSANLKDEGDSLREKERKEKNINEKIGKERIGLDISFYSLDFRN